MTMHPLARSGAAGLRAPGLAVSVMAATAVLAACSSSGRTFSASGDNSATELQTQYEQVVQHVLPSVVQISTGDSTGSGVVYDSRGDIVTNEHVVGTAKEVKVVESVGNKT